MSKDATIASPTDAMSIDVYNLSNSFMNKFMGHVNPKCLPVVFLEVFELVSRVKD